VALFVGQVDGAVVYVVSSQLFSHPVIDRVDAFRENEQLQGRNDEAEAKAAAARQDAAAAEQRARLAAEAEAAAAAAKQAAEQAAEESAAASASAAVASGAEYLLAIENVPAREWWSSCECTSTLLRRLRQTSASSSFLKWGVRGGFGRASRYRRAVRHVRRGGQGGGEVDAGEGAVDVGLGGVDHRRVRMPWHRPRR
jgi:hypothetical protein